jgi:hypothetical protein
MRRSARLPAGGDRANFAPQYFPSRAPLVPYWGAHNSHGEGSDGKDLKRLCLFCSSASLGDRVARIVARFFFAKSVGDGAHEPRGTAPVSPHYVFGRTQDISLQKARNNISLLEPTVAQSGAGRRRHSPHWGRGGDPAVLTRAVAIDFVLLKPWSLPIQKILIAFQWRLYKLASWLTT